MRKQNKALNSRKRFKRKTRVGNKLGMSLEIVSKLNAQISLNPEEKRWIQKNRTLFYSIYERSKNKSELSRFGYSYLERVKGYPWLSCWLKKPVIVFRVKDYVLPSPIKGIVRACWRCILSSVKYFLSYFIKCLLYPWLTK